MVADRSVTVKLKIDTSDFDRGLARAAAEARAFSKSLSGGRGGLGDVGDGFDKAAASSDSFSDSLDRNRDSVDGLGQSLGDAGNGADSFSKSLAGADDNNRRFARNVEASNSRMAVLIQYGIALGPALVPVLATAAPLMTALGSAAAVGAVGVGTMLLAFQGVGDALTAVNKYSLEPTAANLEKLNTKMDTLGPAGKDFVLFLQDLRPELQKLQNIAQENMFPGLQSGIESLLTQMPLIEEVVGSVSSAIGDMAAATGEALTSPFWVKFFTYLRDDAQSIIKDLGSAFGNMFEGVAALVLDFAPLTKDMFAAFDRGMTGFSDWAQNLPETQSFQDFLAYLRDTGPKVLDMFAALGDAIVELGKAAGPAGEASLLALTKSLQAIAALAGSPIGPWLVGAAVGFAAVSRALALYQTAQGAKLVQLLSGFGPVAQSSGKHAATAATGFSALGKSLTAANLARGAAGIAGLTLAMSSFDDSFQLTNTATLGLMGGALFKKWGAAAGVAAGFTMDAVAANDKLDSSIDRVRQTLAEPLNFAAQNEALASARAELEKFTTAVAGEGAIMNIPGAWKNMIEGVFGDSDVVDAQKQLIAVADGIDRMRVAQVNLANSMTGGSPFENTLQDLPRVVAALESARPAFESLNLDMDALFTRSAGTGLGASLASLQLESMGPFVKNFIAQADSAAGRGKNFAQAIADLGNAAFNTALSAGVLSTALSGLIDGPLNEGQAADNFTASLHGLSDELAKSKTLVGDSMAAITNRTAIRGLVTDLEASMTAMAENGRGSKAMALALDKGVDSIMRVGTAAGLNKGELRGFLSTLNLTPKRISTILETYGVGKAEDEVRNLVDAYHSIPERAQIFLESHGIPETEAGMKRLQDRFKNLSNKDIRILTRLKDEASGPLGNLMRKLLGLTKRQWKAMMGADAKQANATLNSAEDRLSKWDRAKGKSSVLADNTSAINSLNDSIRKLNGWDRDKGTAKVDADEHPAMSAIEAAARRLGLFDRDKGTAAADVDNSGAMSAIGAAAAAVRRFGTMSSKATITVLRKNQTMYETIGHNADGNLLDFYANGGTRFPSIGSQQPRIEPNRGPGGITWAETGAGPWEAFISGHPAKKARSRGIADETVERLGGAIQWMADGDIRYQSRNRTPMMRPVMSSAEGASHMELSREIRHLRTAVQRIGDDVKVGAHTGTKSGIEGRERAMAVQRRSG